jgi:hypothetical protein
LLKISILWAMLLPAAAQMYKWVDEKGVTHYGERPPVGKKAQEVEQRLANPAPAPGKASQPNWKDKDLEFRGRRIESEQADTKQQQQKAVQDRICNQARDALSQMKLARRVYHLDAKGERVYQSDDERSASIARQEQLVSQNCR